MAGGVLGPAATTILKALQRTGEHLKLLKSTMSMGRRDEFLACTRAQAAVTTSAWARGGKSSPTPQSCRQMCLCLWSALHHKKTQADLQRARETGLDCAGLRAARIDAIRAVAAGGS